MVSLPNLEAELGGYFFEMLMTGSPENYSKRMRSLRLRRNSSLEEVPVFRGGCGGCGGHREMPSLARLSH